MEICPSFGRRHNGTGSLAITNGGSVSSGYTEIASDYGSTGSVIVNGSSWTNSSELYVGYYGTGSLAIDTSGFSNPNTGVFSLSVSGGSLNLNFAAIPEPSTYALLLLGLGSVFRPALRRHGRKR